MIVNAKDYPVQLHLKQRLKDKYSKMGIRIILDQHDDQY